MSPRGKPVAGTGRHNQNSVKTGVTELDKIVKQVKKQGGRVKRAGHGFQIRGPNGEGPVFMTGSKPKSYALANLKAALRRNGLRVK